MAEFVITSKTILSTSGLTRKQIGRLTAERHLGPLEKYCDEAKTCRHSHRVFSQSDNIQNIQTWPDVAPYLIRRVYLDRIISDLEEETKKNGELTAICWDTKGSHFTIKDIRLLSNIIENIQRIKYTVVEELQILSSDE